MYWYVERHDGHNNTEPETINYSAGYTSKKAAKAVALKLPLKIATETVCIVSEDGRIEVIPTW